MILPETVQFIGAVPGSQARGKVQRSLTLPHGMLMAQAAHVVSKMRVDRKTEFGDCPITTIVLGVRNSKELFKIGLELIKYKSARIWQFHDTNESLYGGNAEVLTAICTEPIEKSKIEDEIGHLELF